MSSIFTEMKNIAISLTLTDNGHIALSLEIVQTFRKLGHYILLFAKSQAMWCPEWKVTLVCYNWKKLKQGDDRITMIQVYDCCRCESYRELSSHSNNGP